MVFTRYGDPFSTSELDEYETLARQIAIYLEKIKLFEQSEDGQTFKPRYLKYGPGRDTVN